LFALLLPAFASAGVYEDMEEALISGNTPWAIQLINRGMDVNSVDAAGNTLLMQTVQRDNMDFFDYLLKRRARLNTRNRNGETALSLAAYQGKLPFVKRLVEAGADVNLYGWPPLIYAAFNGHAAVVDYLLKKGAEINATDREWFDGAAVCRTLRAPRSGRVAAAEQCRSEHCQRARCDGHRLGAEDREHRYRRPLAQGWRARRQVRRLARVKVRKMGAGDAPAPCLPAGSG
jgi:hypothetical protein